MSISIANNVFIVLATYEPNLEFFSKQVSSIISQNYIDWFCLVTDDGSSPEKLRAIRQIVSADARFEVIHSEKQVGSVNNFARGLAQVKPSFNYVAFADQDDIWEANKLTTLVGILEKNPDVTLVHSDLSLIDKEDRIIADSCWRNEKRVLKNINYSSLVYRNVITGCSAVFRREILSTALPMAKMTQPAVYHHDVWIALHALSWGKIYSLDKPLVRYRQHGGNLVGTQTQDGFVVFIKKLFSWQKVGEKSKNAFNVRRILATDFVCALQRKNVETELAIFIEPLTFLKLGLLCLRIFKISGFNLNLYKNGLQIAFGLLLLIVDKSRAVLEERKP